MYDFPYDLELQWPVDFEEITEWTPLWYEIPGTLDHMENDVHYPEKFGIYQFK